MKTNKSRILKLALFATGLSGIVAEYILSTLATYFLGDSVFQWTMILSVMLFAMGVGSRISTKFDTKILEKFLVAEFCLSLLTSTAALSTYFFIGVTEYKWKFIGSDINEDSIANAQSIIDSNESLKGKIELRLQHIPKNIFRGVLTKEDKIDISICNPPFHTSLEEAQKGTRRKIKNLTGKSEETLELNFAGISEELICEGGEAKFLENMILESKEKAKNCFWFSTLVSKQSNVKRVCKSLETIKARQVKTIPMGTGNKSSRIVAWTFLSEAEQKEWRESRWEKKDKKE